MAGCQMCSGENSVPTWPFHCFDRSILTIDRSPELTAVSPRPFVKNTPDGSTSESRAPTTPVALRPVSASHVPAVVSAPGAQFRKDCWLSQKPSFGRRLRRGQRFFRNWGLESGNEAGEWGRDEIRNLTGELTWSLGGFRPGSATGTFKVGSRTNQYGADYQTGPDGYSVMFDASNDFQTGPQNVPQHVWQPICLYLGRPA